jgi:2-keto-4-pentenoate hydratase
MALSRTEIEKLAGDLFRAEAERVPISPLTDAHPQLTVEEAYQIQLVNIEAKRSKGAKIVGKKIGLTSIAMQRLLGVDQPDYGHLFDDMALADGDAMKAADLIQPKVEAEVAFILKEDLIGPGITVARVLAATEYVIPALEIVDSRVRDWKIKLADTIADNASSARIVLGGRALRVTDLNLSLIGLVLEKNGEIANTAAGAAVLGHPAKAVAWLGNKLAEFGIPLKAGEVIMPGALSAAVDARAGDVIRGTFDHLGSVSVRFV